MITSSNKKGMGFKSIYTNGVVEALSDASAKAGGEGKTFGAYELLEASLCSCLSITVRKYAETHSIPLDEIKVTVKFNNDDPENPVFEKDIKFIGDLTDEQRQKLISASKTCNVYKMLSKSVPFKEIFN